MQYRTCAHAMSAIALTAMNICMRTRQTDFASFACAGALNSKKTIGPDHFRDRIAVILLSDTSSIEEPLSGSEGLSYHQKILIQVALKWKFQSRQNLRDVTFCITIHNKIK